MKDLFLLDPSVVFLNHGSFGACPRPVFEAYQGFQRELEHRPVEFLALERRFPELIEGARARLADHLGASRGNLAFATNASSALNAVARSLELGPGDEVLLGDAEYGGMELLWSYVAERSGATLVRRPLVVSWDWTDGASFPERHRWQGTRDPSAFLAVPAAIDFQAEHDWPAVRRRCHELLAAPEFGLEPLTDDFVQMRGFRVEHPDPAGLKRRLYDEHRIEVPVFETPHGWVLRVSVQGYNDEDDLRALADCLGGR